MGNQLQERCESEGCRMTGFTTDAERAQVTLERDKRCPTRCGVWRCGAACGRGRCASTASAPNLSGICRLGRQVAYSSNTTQCKATARPATSPIWTTSSSNSVRNHCEDDKAPDVLGNHGTPALLDSHLPCLLCPNLVFQTPLTLDSPPRLDSPRRGSRQTGSNRRPADYKSAALPTELYRHCTRPLLAREPRNPIAADSRLIRRIKTRVKTCVQNPSNASSQSSRPAGPGDALRAAPQIAEFKIRRN